MVLVHAFIKVKDGAEQEFIHAANKCIEATRKETGNKFYTLYAEAGNPRKFIFVEEWESKPALDAHMLTAHFQEFGGEINDLLAEPLDIAVYEASKI